MAGIWETITGLVAAGKIAAQDAGLLIKASIGAAQDLKSGAAKNPLQALLNQAPNLKPVLESVIAFLVPGAGTAADVGIEALSYLLTHAHKMTPAEEAHWMDRASRTDNGGS